MSQPDMTRYNLVAFSLKNYISYNLFFPFTVTLEQEVHTGVFVENVRGKCKKV